MDEHFDTQTFLVRTKLVAEQIRHSDAFPALIGGVAGGLAGALIAALVAGRVAGRVVSHSTHEAAQPEKASTKPQWSMREAAQLATVAASLFKQFQTWSKEHRA
jgi:hypothetical protein